LKEKNIEIPNNQTKTTIKTQNPKRQDNYMKQGDTNDRKKL